MKKLISILLAAFLILSAFAGCASFNNDSDNSGINERQISGKLQSFSAKTLLGEEFTPGDFAEFDLTIINFWATYCGPCIGEMDELAELKASLPENVGFIMFCTDALGNESEAGSILSEHKLDATVISSADGDFTSLLSQIMYVPTTIFVDRSGSIVGSEIIGSPDNLLQKYGDHIKAALTEAGVES